MINILLLGLDTGPIVENGFLGRLSLETRKRWHFLVLVIYKIKNRLGGFSYTLIRDDRKKTNRPIIFAITHVGKYDIEIVSEAIREHYFLLSGDYEHIQGIIDEPFLLLNGVIFFNETDKKDRKTVQNRMIELLREGGNLMYFPEGTWNITPNLPVLPCYWGIVAVAQQGNAIIIPVAVEQYEKRFDIIIGKNIDMKEFGNSPEEKSRAIIYLRDILATLKWEIWERHTAKRTEIDKGEWTEYCETRFREWPGFNKEYIARLVYKPR